MATRKRFVKDLRDEKNINIIQLLKSFLYGDVEIKKYLDGKRYSKGDVVIKYDSTTKRFNTYRCIVTTSSTTWVNSEWQKETIDTSVFKMADKIIVHSTQQPNNIDNKLWMHDIKTNPDGTVNTVVKVKNKNNGYDTLYTATVTDNVYLNSNRTSNLTNKLSVMDSERTRIRSEYLMDVLNLLFELGVAIPSSKSQKFIHILDVTDEVEVSNLAVKYKGIISI